MNEWKTIIQKIEELNTNALRIKKEIDLSSSYAATIGEVDYADPKENHEKLNKIRNDIIMLIGNAKKMDPVSTNRKIKQWKEIINRTK
ncbi:MAG: hypothetical protein KGL95_01220 [Patescibacteria group bacterium]|nr:hypothetical protein [Patescibacteria group bacterium]